MNLTDNEKRTVREVLGELLKKPYKELNTFLGSITIQEMQILYNKMKYEKYCEEHGIRYEDMTENDFIQAYEEDFDDCESYDEEE